MATPITTPPCTKGLGTQEIHQLGVQLFGPGLLSRVYIAELAKELDLPAHDVRKRWYGLDANQPMNWTEILAKMPPKSWISWDDEDTKDYEHEPCPWTRGNESGHALISALQPHS